MITAPSTSKRAIRKWTNDEIHGIFWDERHLSGHG
jgi:hypothetical protein